MPDIFDILTTTTPGHGGEIQLTDAMAKMLGDKLNRKVNVTEFRPADNSKGDKKGVLHLELKNLLYGDMVLTDINGDDDVMDYPHPKITLDDDGNVIGLTPERVRHINQLLSNAASQNVKPAVNPLTEIAMIDGLRIMIIDVPKGINKPYQDKNGVIWVKSGADKRKATSREEIQRLFQDSGMVHADTIPTEGMTIADIDMPYFREFFQKRYGEALDEQTVPLSQTISNLNLGKNEALNITGGLLFGQSPSNRLPAFIVKAAAFPGKTLAQDTYIDSRDITGKISEIFQQTIGFILANTRQVQGEQSVNSLGLPEIPRKRAVASPRQWSST